MLTDICLDCGRVCRSRFVKYGVLMFLFFLYINRCPELPADSFDLALNNNGVSFGNSKHFNGLRINAIDRDVAEIKGVNITILKARNNMDARVHGISIGIISPEAGHLNGIQIGGIGVLAENELNGIAIGGLSAASKGNVSGIMLDGLGAGAGENFDGAVIALLGAGSGNNITGIALGGLGAGCGNDLKGLILGGLGAGAGVNTTGLVIGGLGAGAGENVNGAALALLGAGAGNNLTGIAMGGLGAGCGNNLKGLAIGGLGTGAGGNITGAAIALGTVQLQEEKTLTGFLASAYNNIKGTQKGVSLGIYNYAAELHGIQLGMINFAQNNPKFLRLLPFINFNFD